MPVGDIPMSPSVAPLAVRQRELSTTTPEAPELPARCIPQCVLSVARNVKCPLSLEKAGQCIVVTATARIGQPLVSNSRSLIQRGLEPNPAPDSLEMEELGML